MQAATDLPVADRPRRAVVQTYSGRLVDLAAFTPDDVVLQDITHALAMQARFTGHTLCRYSVAQHSMLVAYLCPPELAKQALFHDASEAYLGDVSTPLKSMLPDYVALEAKIQHAICEAMGVPHDLDPRVKEADRLALEIEYRRLMLPRNAIACRAVPTPAAITPLLAEHDWRVVREWYRNTCLAAFRGQPLLNCWDVPDLSQMEGGVQCRLI